MDLSRVAMVIGKNKLPVLGQARIAVVGLGGVGSYVAAVSYTHLTLPTNREV